jgi:hypothetical protein
MQKKNVSDSLERTNFPYNKMNLETKSNKIVYESKINHFNKIDDVVLNKDVNPFIMNTLSAR